jgi:acyl carrier protein
VFGISEATAAVCETIATIWPHRFGGTELRDELSLGEDGLGLDSVEVVELLMACEERFGREAGEELLATAPLTIERVARYFARD